MQMSKLDAAEVFYNKALSIRKEVLGEDHPDTAALWSNLALVARERKNYQQSKELFTRYTPPLRFSELGSRGELHQGCPPNLWNT